MPENLEIRHLSSALPPLITAPISDDWPIFVDNEFSTQLPVNVTGWCGSMAYSALAYYLHQQPIPADAELPPVGSKLGKSLTTLQVRGYKWNADHWRFYLTQTADLHFDEVHQHGLKSGAEFQWLVQEINAGRPCVLTLIAPPSETVIHHQVVAFGYPLSQTTS